MGDLVKQERAGKVGFFLTWVCNSIEGKGEDSQNQETRLSIGDFQL